MRWTTILAFLFFFYVCFNFFGYASVLSFSNTELTHVLYTQLFVRRAVRESVFVCMCVCVRCRENNQWWPLSAKYRNCECFRLSSYDINWLLDPRVLIISNYCEGQTLYFILLTLEFRLDILRIDFILRRILPIPSRHYIRSLARSFDTLPYGSISESLCRRYPSPAVVISWLYRITSRHVADVCIYSPNETISQHCKEGPLREFCLQLLSKV